MTGSFSDDTCVRGCAHQRWQTLTRFIRLQLCEALRGIVPFYLFINYFSHQGIAIILRHHGACVTAVTVAAKPRGLCLTLPPIKVICESALNRRRHNVIGAVLREKGMNSLLRPISGDR